MAHCDEKNHRLLMNLNDIDYLVAVAEHRHVGRAAEALGLTQSALTRALARLEALAGLPLFERHPKGVMPTEAGLAFLRRARRIQLEYDDTLSELHQMKTGSSASCASATARRRTWSG
ncbi:bacterial regulatory helix-turn-helix protein, lysR family domain-containing protein [Ditylenchus destructor]|nr:bacterial regulatory helix-turn-helix protein, lysR family domain-containing protein [Ditylenchus destructor]